MTHSISFARSARLGLLLSGFGLAGSAMAQGVSLNYDRLAFIEEPLAVEVGDITFSASALFDVPLTFDLEESGGDVTNIDLFGSFQVNVETQLANRWTVGASYFGEYLTGAPGSDYVDRGAAFIGGSWGTFVVGNVSGLVREETRRLRGVGNGFLAFDDFLGGLSDVSFGYAGRFGPTRLSTIVDEDGNFEIGATFQRPIGNKDYRFTARYSDSESVGLDGLIAFTSRGGAGVVEFIYGSSLFDLGVGYERLGLAGTSFDENRWYTSAGARHKVGGITVSAEGHYGELGGQSEVSAALGAALDIARGLSLNFGLNYSDADVDILAAQLISIEETKAIISLRYGF